MYTLQPLYLHILLLTLHATHCFTLLVMMRTCMLPCMCHYYFCLLLQTTLFCSCTVSAPWQLSTALYCPNGSCLLVLRHTQRPFLIASSTPVSLKRSSTALRLYSEHSIVYVKQYELQCLSISIRHHCCAAYAYNTKNALVWHAVV